MRFQRIALPALVAAALSLLPGSPAKAQPYYYPCNPFPLFWPLCVVGAIVTLPFRVLAGPYYYPYYSPPYYGTPAVPYHYPAAGEYYPPGPGYSPSYSNPTYSQPPYASPGYAPPGPSSAPPPPPH